MGRLIVTEFITLDGVIEAPGGGEGFEHAGWSFKFDRGSAGDQFKVDELTAADVQLLGRVTYQGFAAAWPGMSGADEFSAKMNRMPKYVVSDKLTDALATWENSTVIRGDVAGQVQGLKSRTPGDVLVAGSGQLVRALTAWHLVDEYRLMVFPIVLGSGKRLFEPGTSQTVLRLSGTQPVGPDGVVILTYGPA